MGGCKPSNAANLAASHPIPPHARPLQGRPVPSLLRGYSAPVKLTVEGQTDDDLEFLLAHDTGAWQAGHACLGGVGCGVE